MYCLRQNGRHPNGQWTLRLRQPLQYSTRRFLQRFCAQDLNICVGCRIVTLQIFRLDVRALNINGDIKPDWPWPPALRQMQRAFEMITNRLRVFNQDRVFGYTARHANDISFLIAQLPQA